MNKPHVSKIGVFGDNRGLFFPLKLEPQWIQSNISINKKWTFRGLHHQVGETSQAKLVSIVKGSIVDFLVDLNEGSFEEAYFFKLYPGDQIYVPRGFAHGFLSLEDDTIIQYLVDNEYSPKTEISFDWKSNETVKELILAEVGDEKNLLMSSKDLAGVKISREYAESKTYRTLR